MIITIQSINGIEDYEVKQMKKYLKEKGYLYRGRIERLNPSIKVEGGAYQRIDTFTK